MFCEFLGWDESNGYVAVVLLLGGDNSLECMDMRFGVFGCHDWINNEVLPSVRKILGKRRSHETALPSGGYQKRPTPLFKLFGDMPLPAANWMCVGRGSGDA